MYKSTYRFSCDRLRSALASALYTKYRDNIQYCMAMRTLLRVQENCDCQDEKLKEEVNNLLSEDQSLLEYLRREN
jgi:hypothetical protein